MTLSLGRPSPTCFSRFWDFLSIRLSTAFFCWILSFDLWILLLVPKSDVDECDQSAYFQRAIAPDDDYSGTDNHLSLCADWVLFPGFDVL